MLVGAPEEVGSSEGEGSPERVGTPEGVGSLGSSGSWTLLPYASQPLMCTTEMRRRSCNVTSSACIRTHGAVQVYIKY